MAEPRYVIIHGHFYQPPRESPWTGLITPETSAAPFANWNERILSDCYTANAHAHTMEGSIVHVRNNYESISFDVGPTLAAWLERHGRTAHRAMVRGDELSRAARGRHGNAIAQSYSHSILPLGSPRDREIQVAWGIQDFSCRFGRPPRGIWLPECAVDDDTLASIAESGLEYTIVANDQGRFSGDGAQGRTAGPFLWRGNGRTVAVFRFDRALSAAISFGDALNDGTACAAQIADAALSLEPGEAIMIATDGETFGHHKRRGASELARAVMMLARRDDILVVNCEQYLARRPAGGSFSLNGATSWSCAHGVERWRANCGCRLAGDTSQEWRAPLFGAMEFAKNHTLAIYDRFAPELCPDSRAALNDAARAFVDPRPAVQEEFFKRHKIADEYKRERMLRLFEMVRAGQAALTSCGWFFDDFSGLEGRIVLRWAARALEIAGEFAADVEGELLERLRELRSNRRDIKDGATLYLSLKTRKARGRV